MRPKLKNNIPCPFGVYFLSMHVGVSVLGAGGQKIKYTGHKNVWLWRKSRRAI